MLQCLRSWGGPTPIAQRRVTTPAQGPGHQVCRHTHATHACTQLPNTLGAPPTSTQATLLEWACAQAGGILGSGSRTPSPHRGASFQPVGGCQGGEQLVQRCQQHRATGVGGRTGGRGPSKAGSGDAGAQAPWAGLQAEGRAGAQMPGRACLGVQWLVQEQSRGPGGPRTCCHPGC